MGPQRPPHGGDQPLLHRGPLISPRPAAPPGPTPVPTSGRLDPSGPDPSGPDPSGPDPRQPVGPTRGPDPGATPIELSPIRRAFSGHGLAVVDDRPVFVPGVSPGERARAAGVVEVRGRLWAHDLTVLEADAQRGDPGCAQFGRCPGCPLRHLQPEHALAAKVAAHRETLLRRAELGPEVPVRVYPGPARDGHRHRLVARGWRLPDGRLSLGLGSLPGHTDPVPLGACPAQEPAGAALLRQIEADLQRLGVRPADADSAAGLRHVAVQTHAIAQDHATSPTHLAGATVVLGFGADGPDLGDPAVAPSDAALRAGVLAEHPEVSLFVERFGRRHNPVGSALQHLRGPTAAWIALDGHRLRATPPAWTPQTPGSVPAVRAALLELLAPRPTDQVVEVGCGIGTLSLPLAARVAQLVGIDACREAVADATFNAEAAGLTQARFRVGRADHALRRLRSAGARADLVVLHAMRLPYGPAVLDAVRHLGPRRVVLIGPSVAAVTEDLVSLRPWRAEAVAFVDQLPGTTGLLNLVALVPPDAGGCGGP